MHDWIYRLRLWLWQWQARMLERSVRPTGTNDGDWIGANVAASAASAGSQAGAHHGFTACDSGGVSYSDGGSCGSAGAGGY